MVFLTLPSSSTASVVLQKPPFAATPTIKLENEKTRWPVPGNSHNILRNPSCTHGKPDTEVFHKSTVRSLRVYLRANHDGWNGVSDIAKIFKRFHICSKAHQLTSFRESFTNCWKVRKWSSSRVIFNCAMSCLYLRTNPIAIWDAPNNLPSRQCKPRELLQFREARSLSFDTPAALLSKLSRL